MNEAWHYYTTENDWTGASGNHYAVYNERHMTSAWAGANAQYQFFSSDWTGYKEGETIQIWSKEGMKNSLKYDNIQKGDLMFFVHKETGEVYHSTIISLVTDDEIKYAAHTQNRNYEKLSSKLDQDMVVIVKIRDDAELGYTK